MNRLSKSNSFGPGVLVAILLAGGAALGGHPPHWASRAHVQQEVQVVLQLADAPEAVRNTLAKHTSGEPPTRIIKVERPGITTYRIAFKVDDTERAVELSTAGDVLAIDTRIEESSLPAAILDALRKNYPGGIRSELSTRQAFSYRVAITIDDRKREVLINAAGEIDDRLAQPSDRTVALDRDIVAAVLVVRRSADGVLAEISAGSRDGVREGCRLTIADGGTFIGNLRITKVDVNRSTGVVELEDREGRGEVKAGQRVIARTGG